MFYAGRYIFSLPFLLAILPFIKTKAEKEKIISSKRKGWFK